VTTAPLETRHVGKRWVGTLALHDVSLRFEAGKVHALVGSNGAGKSTLVKILAGATVPSTGEVRVAGAAVSLRSPLVALRHGIATVHQELSLVGALTVAENLFLGRYPRRRSAPFLVDPAATRRQAEQVLGELGVDLDPGHEVAALSFAEAQLVEIARAVSRAPRALLLDEPTSALSSGEVDALVRVVRKLAARGVAVVHVTHRLDELPRVADVVSVLRDGELVGTIDAADAGPARLADMMFGRQTPAAVSPPTAAVRERPVVLSTRGLTSGPRVQDVTLEVRAGEVLGLAGLLGSGRSELLMALFGAREVESGEVRIAGEVVRAFSPRRLAAAGVALVPEDRKRQGLALPMSVLDNASLPSLPRLARFGLLGRRGQVRAVEPVLRRLRLVAASLGQRVATLSGGNQQKVVVGKWLLEPRRVLLLDEPTRGVDLEARRDLVGAVRELAAQGVAVVMVSSELEELLPACDRILVMRHGRIVGELDPARTRLDALLARAMGA
jgi:ABC-type sugar transport system ATPase subunit